MVERFTVAEWRISSIKSLASVSHRPQSIVMLTVGGEIGMWVEMWVGTELGLSIEGGGHIDLRIIYPFAPCKRLM